MGSDTPFAHEDEADNPLRPVWEDAADETEIGQGQPLSRLASHADLD